MSAFKDRLKLAMDGPPKVSQAALARACNIKPPSVNDWLSGKTKTIEGANLLNAARFLRVNPDWLASNKGPMRQAGAGVVTEDDAASQSAGLDPETLASAMKLARHLVNRLELPGDVTDHPALIGEAYLGLLDLNRLGKPGDVLELADKLAARIKARGQGDERRSDQEAGGQGGGVRRRSARESKT